MRHSMPIPTENSTPEEWLAYANWLRFTENARLAKKATFFRETGNYVAEEDFLFEIEENEKEIFYIENKYAPVMEYNHILNGNAFRTAKKANRRKQNKKNKSRDRIHGRRHGGAHGGVDFRYVDCNPFCNKHQYVDAMFAINGKHHHNADRKASAMTAREQDFLFNPSTSEMEIEQEEKRMSELDTRILDNHYALENVFSNLKEGKYISLFSYWNGEYWEDSSIETNKFCGIKTAEEVKDKVLTEQARRIHLPKIEMETVCEMEGISFQWNSFYDWDDEECGYRKLTFLPLN